MDPLLGRDAIRQMFVTEVGRAAMTCVVERILEDGEWASLTPRLDRRSACPSN